MIYLICQRIGIQKGNEVTEKILKKIFGTKLIHVDNFEIIFI